VASAQSELARNGSLTEQQMAMVMQTKGNYRRYKNLNEEKAAKPANCRLEACYRDLLLKNETLQRSNSFFTMRRKTPVILLGPENPGVYASLSSLMLWSDPKYVHVLIGDCILLFELFQTASDSAIRREG